MKKKIIDIIEDFEYRMSDGFGYHCADKKEMLSELSGQIMQQFIPIKLLQDGSSHWYVIPNDLSDEFIKSNNYICDHEDDDGIENIIVEFENKFGKYRTGGSPNIYQLLISQKELNKLIQ